MLPFLKRTHEASASGPVESKEMDTHPDDDIEFDPLETAMQELCEAVTAKDYVAAAAAFRAAFDLLEQEPHNEYPED